MPATSPNDKLTITQASALMGIKAATFRAYRARNARGIPGPDGHIGRSPFYYRRTIEKVIKAGKPNAKRASANRTAVTKREKKRVVVRVSPLTATVSAAEAKQIDAFLDKVNGLPKKSQQMLALSELSRIHRRAHPDGRPFAATSNRRLISEYRNAARARWGENAPILAWMKYSMARTNAYRDLQGEQREQRHRNQRPITLDRHITTAITLLEHVLLVRMSIAGAIAGVIALTGRRPYEVACTGTFEAAPRSKTDVLFSGQAKTRDETRSIDAYTFPALARRDLVIETVERLRTLVPVTPNRVFNVRWAKEIGMWSKRYFRDDKGNPILPRELREAYAAIAYNNHAIPGISPVAYYNQVLGHQTSDFNTSLFYFDFYIPKPQQSNN